MFGRIISELLNYRLLPGRKHFRLQMICLIRPSESRKHGIFCESKLAPEEKCLEIQNCVNAAPN